MFESIRRRLPSPAMMVAILALFVAVGGSAYAANKIGAKDIKPLHLYQAAEVVNGGKARVVTANCKDTQRAISGGAYWNGASTIGPVLLTQSSLGRRSFTAGGRNEGSGQRELYAQVLCLTK